jgi:hypothetical protein
MNILIILIIIAASLILGLIKYKQIYYGYNDEKNEINLKGKAPWQWRFSEFWNFFVSFLLGGFLGYYFISFRWPVISDIKTLQTIDFVLMIIFMMCITGWFPYFIKNITEGITTIVKRIIEK